MAISSNVRIKILTVFFLLAAVLLLTRLFNWQVVRARELSRLGASQHRTTSTVLAHRGSILASDDFPLVSSREAWLVWASLKEIKDPQGVASQLADFLAPDPESVDETSTQSGVLAGTTLEQVKTKKELVAEEGARLEKLLRRSDVVWVPLKHKVTKEIKEKIESLKIAGIGFDLEEVRGYPEGTMSAQVLGFVGKDTAGSDKGYFGLEGFYDLTLSGTRGTKSWEKDASGNPILLGSSRNIGSLEGLSLKTHIDRTVQFTIEKHLREGIVKYGASGGTVIVMRPQDGAILGMASFPAYDPANFTSFDDSLFTNPGIGDAFEPGSIFKVLVMAAALDSGVVKPEDKCECTGPRRIAEYTIKTSTDKYYPGSTPREIIQHSDNVGMIWVAERLGADKLIAYLSRFGIGRATGIDLQGEANPGLRDRGEWTSVDLATSSFGQGVAVTPIQMVRAVGVIANSGRLTVPHVVDRVLGQGWEQDIKPDIQENILSNEAVAQITEMMVGAVDYSIERWSKPLVGFRIAGKTGTAQIPIEGHYDKNKTIASFVGFAPAPKAGSNQVPKFVMLVTLRKPTSSPWADATAAPVWFRIAEDLFPYFGIQPE